MRLVAFTVIVVVAVTLVCFNSVDEVTNFKNFETNDVEKEPCLSLLSRSDYG